MRDLLASVKFGGDGDGGGGDVEAPPAPASRAMDEQSKDMQVRGADEQLRVGLGWIAWWKEGFCC